ncbi:MAG: serpin family protein [Polyangiaceae bacterium]
MLSPPSDEERRSGEQQSTFALDFDSILRRHAVPSPDESYVYSPLALGSALAMAYEGARGSTRAELGRLIRLESEDDLAGALGLAVLESTAGVSQRGVFKLTQANALWCAPNYQPLPSFTARLRASYRAELLTGKRDRAPEMDINDWVARATGGRLAELLAPDSLRSDTRIVLANVLDVEATWLQQFHREQTAMRPFRTIDGKTVQLPTMVAKGNRAVSIGDDYDAVDLVLSDLEHRVLFVVPHAGKFRAFQHALQGRLKQIRGSLKPLYVHVELPHFRIENRLFLRDALAEAGLKLSLSETADFGNMVAKRVFLDQVIQGARFEIDEFGVRATAATALSFPPPSVPPKPRIIRFDKPFVFLLHNVRTKAILFAGSFTGDRSHR